jgi:hypothetical protein
MKKTIIDLTENQKDTLYNILKEREKYLRDDIKEDVQNDINDVFIAKELNNIQGILDQILIESDLKIIKRVFVLEANRLTKNPIQLQNLTNVYYKITKRDLKVDYIEWFDFNRDLLK